MIRYSLRRLIDTLPTLARAEKIIDRLERAGVLEAASDQGLSAEQVGDQLVAIIRSAHASGVNADEALRVAIRELERSAQE